MFVNSMSVQGYFRLLFTSKQRMKKSFAMSIMEHLHECEHKKISCWLQFTQRPLLLLITSVSEFYIGCNPFK